MVKTKLTISITPDTVRWIDEQVKQGRFADRSHAVQYSLLKVKELINNGELKF